MVIVRTKVVRRFHASAITAWPFIFADPDLDEESSALRIHEPTHGRQQFWMFLGLTVLCPPIAWFAYYWLYLVGFPFGLPFWFNPFRDFVERRAYRAEGYLDCQINQILRKPPYYLRFLIW